jgi:hypothetical protein
MATTSVHFPKGLMEQLDQVAQAQGLSRNRLIVEACRQMLDEGRAWPEGFFSNDHLSADDLEELRAGGDELLRGILAGRRSRSEAPF